MKTVRLALILGLSLLAVSFMPLASATMPCSQSPALQSHTPEGTVPPEETLIEVVWYHDGLCTPTSAGIWVDESAAASLSLTRIGNEWHLTGVSNQLLQLGTHEIKAGLWLAPSQGVWAWTVWNVTVEDACGVEPLTLTGFSPQGTTTDSRPTITAEFSTVEADCPVFVNFILDNETRQPTWSKSDGKLTITYVPPDLQPGTHYVYVSVREYRESSGINEGTGSWTFSVMPTGTGYETDGTLPGAGGGTQSPDTLHLDEIDPGPVEYGPIDEPMPATIGLEGIADQPHYYVYANPTDTRKIPGQDIGGLRVCWDAADCWFTFPNAEGTGVEASATITLTLNDEALISETIPVSAFIPTLP